MTEEGSMILCAVCGREIWDPSVGRKLVKMDGCVEFVHLDCLNYTFGDE